MDEAMEALLRASNRLCTMERGMPAVGLSYNPYACTWTAWADYSDAHKVLEQHDTPSGAVSKLLATLTG